MPHSIDLSHERVPEGFPHQRLVVIPRSVLDHGRNLPIVSQLYVTHIGSFPSAPQHYIERTAEHRQAILLYCTSGRGWVEMDHHTFPVQAGNAAFIPPETAHIYEADREQPWSLFWIHFDGPQTQRVLESLQVSTRNPILYIPDIDAMRQAFEEVYACLNYNYSDAGLLAMTSELMRLLSRIKLNSSSRYQAQQHTRDRIQESIRFMENHLNISPSLSDLAARSGLSVPQFSKLFNERTDQSPMAYYISLKIRKACDLLYQTDLSVGEIGAKLGYEDPYYFSRLFKKVQGCSPAHYRASIMTG